MSKSKERKNSAEPQEHIQIMLLGKSRVGKSSIISQFLYEEEKLKYKPTVEEFYRVEFEIEGEVLILDLLDTSGEHEFPAMRELSIKQSQAFVVVYSIDDAASWLDAKWLRDEIISLRGNKVPIVVVANKIDLLDMSETDLVSLAETKNIVEMEWGHTWIQASTFSPSSVLEIFKSALCLAKIPYRLSPAVEKRRKSLPSYTQKHKHSAFFLKRHSCNVS